MCERVSDGGYNVYGGKHKIKSTHWVVGKWGAREIKVNCNAIFLLLPPSWSARFSAYLPEKEEET